MESRRVRLLTIGFLNGWLDFKYKNPLSATREEFLLRQAEKDLFCELQAAKLNHDASIAGGLVAANPKGLEYSKSTYDAYLKLKLPWIAKEVKLDNKLTADDKSAWVKFLNEKNKK